MRRRGLTERWLIAVFLLVVSTYAIAEDLTLTTYDPSPRGVCQALWVGNDEPGLPDGSSEERQELFTAQARLFQDRQGGATRDVLAVRDDDQAGCSGGIFLDEGPMAPLASIRRFAKTSLPERPDDLVRGERREPQARRTSRGVVYRVSDRKVGSRSASRPSFLALERYSVMASSNAARALSGVAPYEAIPSSGHRETYHRPSFQMTAVT